MLPGQKKNLLCTPAEGTQLKQRDMPFYWNDMIDISEYELWKNGKNP